MLFANASKIIRNWFLTLQPDIFKIISNLPKWTQERAVVTCPYPQIYNFKFRKEFLEVCLSRSLGVFI